jgi:outer membrane receptor protein involved in Fe transport
MGKIMRLSVCAALLCLSVVGLSFGADAHASIRKTISIPAQGLGPALNAFAKERDLQVVYRSEIVGSLRTKGASGDLTVDEALKQLLSGTGLTYRYIDDKTVTILPVGSASSQEQGTAPPVMGDDPNGASAAAKEGKKSSSDNFRVAQANQGSAQSTSTVASAHQNSTNDQSSTPALTEILVTAQKREERLQDVPISIVALSAEELQRRQVNSIEDLASAVPGLAIESNGHERRIEIRGVASNATTGIGNSSLIGVYLDEADVTSAATTQLALSTYDMERVEVLRGPQGTLYGDGSAGGTVRFITKNPVLNQLGVDTDVAALFTQYGAPSQRINAMLNVPVVADELAVRVAGTFDHEGGWIDQPAADRKNINEQNLSDVRAKMLWEPSTQFSVTAMAEIHRNRAAPSNGEDANGNYTEAFNLTTTPSVTEAFNLYNLTLTYDFGAVRILNTTTYVTQDVNLQNLGYALPLLGPIGSAPPFEVLLSFPETVRNLNEEFRVTSTGSGPWQWTLGGYYRHFRFITDESYYFGSPGPLPTSQIFNEADSLSSAWAAFGDASYKLTERFTLGAGLRYYRDSQEFTGINPAAATQKGTFDSTSPRGYAQYKLTDEVNMYASVAKGFRSGGFNPVGQPNYGPENVRTEELGTKISLLDRRLNANMDVFYSDYTGYQTVGFTVANPVNIISNAGDIWIKGIETDLSWRPLDQWILSFNGTYVDSAFYKISASGTAFAVGDRPDLVPRYTLTGSAQNDFQWNGKPGFVRLDYSQLGPQSLRNRSLGPWVYSESDVIHTLNFNLGLQLNPNLSASLIAQNLLNDRGHTDPQAIYDYATRGRPRTFGVQFSTTF